MIKKKTTKNFKNFDLPLAPNNLPFTVTLDSRLARVYTEPVRFKREKG